MSVSFDTYCTQFKKRLQGLIPLPEVEWSFLRSRLRPASYRRGEALIEAGAPARHFWFLGTGILRFFYVTEDGREFNKAFARRGELVGPLVAAVTGQPCGFFIEAMSDCETVAVPAALIPELYQRHPTWERLGRLLAEQAAVRKEIREREFLIDDPMQRYLRFLERYPGIEHEIPQKQIAAYIGITEVSLSRLLRRARSGLAPD